MPPNHWTNLHLGWIFPKGDCSVASFPYETDQIEPGGIITDRSGLLTGKYEMIQDVITGTDGGDPDPQAWWKLAVDKIESRYAQLTNFCPKDTFALDFSMFNPFARSSFTNLLSVKACVCQEFRTDRGKLKPTCFIRRCLTARFLPMT